MEPGFQPVDHGPPKPDAPKKQRRQIPYRLIAPNLVTLLGLCAGLTSIRMAIEGRMELAVILILVAAVLDGIDGRVARFLKGSSRFGAELDSLTDFVNFGVAPAVLLFMWGLQDFRSLGWIASLLFAICTALRLARFNAAMDGPEKPAWQAAYFTGIPAPSGAVLGMLPIYLSFLGLQPTQWLQIMEIFYVLFIAFLMVSTIPTYSGKTFGRNLRSDLVVPVILTGVVLVALLATYTWQFLVTGTVVYLLSITHSFHSYKRAAAMNEKTGDEPSK